MNRNIVDLVSLSLKKKRRSAAKRLKNGHHDGNGTMALRTPISPQQEAKIFSILSIGKLCT